MIKAKPQTEQTRRPEVPPGLVSTGDGPRPDDHRDRGGGPCACSRGAGPQGPCRRAAPTPIRVPGGPQHRGDGRAGQHPTLPRNGSLRCLFYFNYILLLIISLFLQKAERYRIWITLGGRRTQTNGFHSLRAQQHKWTLFLPNSRRDFFFLPCCLLRTLIFFY